MQCGDGIFCSLSDESARGCQWLLRSRECLDDRQAHALRYAKTFAITHLTWIFS